MLNVLLRSTLDLEDEEVSWCSVYLLGRVALIVTIVCGAVGGIVMIAAGNR